MNEESQAIQCRMVAIDFECTGSVDGSPNVPWQIGLMPVIDGRPAPDQAFASLLRVPLDHPFNLYAPGRWAQRREELALAPTLTDLWPRIGPLLTRCPLIAHHAPTERSILKQFFPLQSFGPWIDTLSIGRMAYPRLLDYKLENIIPNLGWQEEVLSLAPGLAPHDAFYDATACAIFLSHILSYPGWCQATVRQLAGL